MIKSNVLSHRSHHENCHTTVTQQSIPNNDHAWISQKLAIDSQQKHRSRVSLQKNNVGTFSSNAGRQQDQSSYKASRITANLFIKPLNSPMHQMNKMKEYEMRGFATRILGTKRRNPSILTPIKVFLTHTPNYIRKAYSCA
mmetsp:Transcript_306/g.699  ORF Transcript_306/g.699 Transcript_306/m.699 type:complete len:141 (+) Transcript_306:234-656(+)